MPFKERVVLFLKQTWPTLLPGVGMIWLFIDSMERARWVRDSAPFTLCILLGLAFGALLAVSRFGSRFALAYSLFLSLAAVSQAVGSIVYSLPVMLATPALDILWMSNARLVTLAERVAGWLILIFNGGTVKDTGLFVFLIGLLAWNACAWLAWAVMRRRKALDGLLPFGILMVINVYLSGQRVGGFLLFLLLAILLVARTFFNFQNTDWGRRRIDYPDELGLEWSFGAVGIAVIVFLLALSFQQIGTAEGRQQISEIYQNMIKRSEKTAERLFTDVNPPRALEATPQVRPPQLELIGNPLDQGQETIMYVKISDPAPEPVDPYHPVLLNVKRHYWRSVIFTTYTGKGWSSPLPRAERLNVMPSQPPPGRYRLEQTFEIVARHEESLFSVENPVSSTPNTALYFVGPDDSALLRGLPSQYSVVSWAADPTLSQLQTAGTDYPPEIASTYLQLPDGLPRRVRELARRLAGDTSIPYEKARRIESYLRLTYPYRLDVPPPPQNADAVDYFLFQAPGGFCTYYASAMAVLLRLEGVPARVATGYAMGNYDYQRAAFRVPRSAAHAWVEVYFPGYGWVEFEPTAALDTFIRPEGEEFHPSVTVEPQPEEETEISPTGVAIVAGLLLAVVAAVALMFLSGSGRLERRTARRRADSRIEAFYLRVRRALGWAGLSAPVSATPDEFLAACAAPLQPHPRLWSALQSATDLYRQAAFSPRQPAGEVYHSAVRAWQLAFWQWLGLAVRNGLRKKEK